MQPIRPKVLSTLTTEHGQFLRNLHQMQLSNKTNLLSALSIGQLLLKHRSNKNQKQRLILFVGHAIDESKDLLVKLAKKLKKNSISVDVVSFGECVANQGTSFIVLYACKINFSLFPPCLSFLTFILSLSIYHSIYLSIYHSITLSLYLCIFRSPFLFIFYFVIQHLFPPVDKLDAFIAVFGEGCQLVNVFQGNQITTNSFSPTNLQGESSLYDKVQQSGVFGQRVGSGSGIGDESASFEFGVDPSLDPELALALKLSMEEEKGRNVAEVQDALNLPIDPEEVTFYTLYSI